MYDEHARASTEKRKKNKWFFVVINKATGNQIRARVADNVSHWGTDCGKFGVNSHWHQPACLQNYQKNNRCMQKKYELCGAFRRDVMTTTVPWEWDPLPSCLCSFMRMCKNNVERYLFVSCILLPEVNATCAPTIIRMFMTRAFLHAGSSGIPAIKTHFHGSCRSLQFNVVHVSVPSLQDHA